MSGMPQSITIRSTSRDLTMSIASLALLALYCRCMPKPRNMALSTDSACSLSSHNSSRVRSRLMRISGGRPNVLMGSEELQLSLLVTGAVGAARLPGLGRETRGEGGEGDGLQGGADVVDGRAAGLLRKRLGESGQAAQVLAQRVDRLGVAHGVVRSGGPAGLAHLGHHRLELVAELAGPLQFQSQRRKDVRRRRQSHQNSSRSPSATTGTGAALRLS